jgi:hypothetical protein
VLCCACADMKVGKLYVAAVQVDALKPGLLGRDRFEFANAYCNRRAVPVPGGNGRLRYDNSGLSRPAELHVLLRREVMLRRLKLDVLSQLPPKRRQVGPAGWLGDFCLGVFLEGGAAWWACLTMLRQPGTPTSERSSEENSSMPDVVVARAGAPV